MTKPHSKRRQNYFSSVNNWKTITDMYIYIKLVHSLSQWSRPRSMLTSVFRLLLIGHTECCHYMLVFIPSQVTVWCLIAHGSRIMKYKCSLINRCIQWPGYYGPVSCCHHVLRDNFSGSQWLPFNRILPLLKKYIT